MKLKKYKMGSVLDFGKYKGEKVRDIIDNDPGYILWCIANVEWFTCTSAVKDNAEEADEPNHGHCYAYDQDVDVDYDDWIHWIDPLNP